MQREDCKPTQEEIALVQEKLVRLKLAKGVGNTLCKLINPGNPPDSNT